MRRVAAPMIEEIVADRLRRLNAWPAYAVDWAVARHGLRRIVVGDDQLQIILEPEALTTIGGVRQVARRLQDGDALTQSNEGATITVPLIFKRNRGETIAVDPHGVATLKRTTINKPLYGALVRAEGWKRRLMAGDVANVQALAKEDGATATFITRLIRVAFLAPDLKRAVIEGRQPLALTLQTIMTRDLPTSWLAQRTMFRA